MLRNCPKYAQNEKSLRIRLKKKPDQVGVLKFIYSITLALWTDKGFMIQKSASQKLNEIISMNSASYKKGGC